MGIFFTLYSIGDLFPDLKLKEISLIGFLNLARRKDPNNTILVDAGFCHGTAGVTYLFLKMALKTNNSILREAAEFWIKETLSYNKNDGYEFLIGSFQGRAFKKDSSFLEGLYGVAMVYLSFLNPRLLEWDECLLLN